jgi:hypothetical protein
MVCRRRAFAWLPLLGVKESGNKEERTDGQIEGFHGGAVIQSPRLGLSPDSDASKARLLGTFMKLFTPTLSHQLPL